MHCYGVNRSNVWIPLMSLSNGFCCMVELLQLCYVQEKKCLQTCITNGSDNCEAINHNYCCNQKLRGHINNCSTAMLSKIIQAACIIIVEAQSLLHTS